MILLTIIAAFIVFMVVRRMIAKAICRKKGHIWRDSGRRLRCRRCKYTSMKHMSVKPEKRMGSTMLYVKAEHGSYKEEIYGNQLYQVLDYGKYNKSFLLLNEETGEVFRSTAEHWQFCEPPAKK